MQHPVIQNSYIERCEKTKLDTKMLNELRSSNIFNQIISNFNPNYHHMQEQLIKKFNVQQWLKYDLIYLCKQSGLYYYPYQTKDLPLESIIANHYMRTKLELQDQKIRIYELCITRYQLAILELEKSSNGSISSFIQAKQAQNNRSTIFTDQSNDMQSQNRQLRHELNRKEKEITDLKLKLKHSTPINQDNKSTFKTEQSLASINRGLQDEIAKLKSLSNNRETQIGKLKQKNLQFQGDVIYLRQNNKKLAQQLKKANEIKQKLKQNFLRYKNLLTQKNLNYDLLAKEINQKTQEFEILKKGIEESNVVYISQKPQNYIAIEEHIGVLNLVLMKKEEEIRNQKEVNLIMQENAINLVLKQKEDYIKYLKAENIKIQQEINNLVLMKKEEEIRKQIEANIIMQENIRLRETKTINQMDYNKLRQILQQLSNTDFELAAAIHKMKELNKEIVQWKYLYEQEVNKSQCWEIDAAMNQKAINLEKLVKKDAQKLIENVGREAQKIQLRNFQNSKAKYTLLEKEYNEKTSKLQQMKGQLSAKNQQLISRMKYISEIEVKFQNERASNQKRAFLIQGLEAKKSNLQLSLKSLRQQKQRIEANYIKKSDQLKAQFDKSKKQMTQSVLKVVSEAVTLGNTCNSIEDLQKEIKATYSTVLTVSSILESKHKERRCLINLIESNTKQSIAKSELIYKYDTYHRNFISYLSQQNFPFVVILKLQNTGNIIGAFTFGLESQMVQQRETFLFSLKDNGTAYGRDPNTSIQTSVKIHNNYLFFGNSEIALKSNSTNQFQMTLNIFGAKYFKLSDEYPLIGDESKNAVKFEEMEVHRLYFK